MWEVKTEPILIFPFVSFTNTEGKAFCFPRERIIHTETYLEGDVLVDDKTYVTYENHNPKGKGTTLHAVVAMPVNVFRDQVIRPAYEGHPKRNT